VILREIQEIKLRFVISENVFGITNIDGGLVFEQVCLDLENEGYEVQPFIIPAAAKNAPHRRDRVWFIAYRQSNGWQEYRKGIDERKKYKQERNSIWSKSASISKIGNATNTNCNGFQGGLSTNFDKQQSSKEKYVEEHLPFTGQGIPFSKFPTESPICGGNDGLPQQLDGITFSKWRAESIKGYGNAIVPQIAYEIFKQIEKL